MDDEANICTQRRQQQIDQEQAEPATPSRSHAATHPHNDATDRGDDPLAHLHIQPASAMTPQKSISTPTPMRRYSHTHTSPSSTSSASSSTTASQPSHSLPSALAALADAQTEIAHLQEKLRQIAQHQAQQSQSHPSDSATTDMNMNTSASHGGVMAQFDAFSIRGMDHSIDGRKILTTPRRLHTSHSDSGVDTLIEEVELVEMREPDNEREESGNGTGHVMDMSQSHTRNARESSYALHQQDPPPFQSKLLSPTSSHRSHGLCCSCFCVSGAGPHTISIDEYFRTPMYRLLLKRLPWLVGLLILQSFSASILHSLEGFLDQHVLFTFFIPMVVGTGGNAGNQCSVMVTRALALGMGDSDVVRVVKKETPISIVTAVVLGCIAFIRVVAEYPDDGISAAAIALALALSILISIALGIGFSYGIEKLNRCDPADGAAPLLTTISDLIGIGLLCGIAVSMV